VWRPAAGRRYHSDPLHALVLAALLAAAPANTATSPEDLARRVQARHQQVSDLRASFVQRYRSGVLGRSVTERGTLWLKRPGRMLWQYEQPEKKTFVSDGTTFSFYVPADKQVVQRAQGGDDGLPGLLLSGRGELTRDFDVGLEPSPRAGLQRLRLVPRKAQPEIERAYLDVDPAGRILAIEVVDAQGDRSQFEFSDMRENIGLKDELFRFEVPRGVEVVTG
jgi:outer membrane lipoprotein carrier protein